MKKALFLTFSSILLLSAGVFLFLNLMPAEQVKAGTNHNVSGWAWSENTGWISFNCSNCENNPQCDRRATCNGTHKDYGVDIDNSGVLSGYAWAENIGWLTFNPAELSGCPVPPCRAAVNLLTGEVSGWAKALAANEPQSGGWEGWLRLRGSTYGVNLSLDTTIKRFSGWAWGGGGTQQTAAIGWVSFSCENQGSCANSNYKSESTFNFPPVASGLQVTADDYCAFPAQNFSWTFSDVDGGGQAAYQLQVDKEGNFTFFGPGEVDTGKVDSSSNNKLVVTAASPGEDQLGYNSTYYWRVKVWDDQPDQGESSWAAGPLFSTPLHMYPRPDFTLSPPYPSEEEVVQLCATQEAGVCPEDVSTCYNLGNNPISCAGKSFLWTFPPNTEFATGSVATSENPRVKFMEPGPKSVTLQITDGAGACAIVKNIGVTFKLPEWREVEPD